MCYLATELGICFPSDACRDLQTDRIGSHTHTAAAAAAQTLVENDLYSCKNVFAWGHVTGSRGQEAGRRGFERDVGAAAAAVQGGFVLKFRSEAVGREVFT